MNLEEIKEYLLGDLTNSVVNDVKPCLNPNSSEGGYFAVPRLVLSYIAYLGKLYRAGYKEFINKVFGAVDSNYRKHGMLFWEIYRNGLIHKYEPVVLENSGHKGNRIDKMQNGLQITHLVPVKIDNFDWIQPISIICLYEDLLASIKQYALLISQAPQIEANLRHAANELQKPIVTTIQWW